MAPSVKIQSTEALAQGASGVLTKVKYSYRAWGGADVSGSREIFQVDDAATVLPMDAQRRTVLLARQLRLPAWLHGRHETLLEACAGKLDGETPETCILREAREELGYELHDLRKAFEVYMSPGYSTERVTGFLAGYTPSDKTSEGGGLKDEGEHIEVVELSFEAALAMLAAGDILDMKTVALLQHAKLHLSG